MAWRNVGGADRVVRAVVGIGLGVVALGLGGAGQIVAAVLAVVGLVTGVLGSCPLYRLVGLRTCPAPQAR